MLEPVTIVASAAAFIGVRYGLGRLGIVFPFDDFDVLAPVDRVACIVVFSPLVGKAIMHAGALSSAYELELSKIQHRGS